MKTLVELKQLYEKELVPILTPLEARRRSLANTLMIIGGIVIAIALIMLVITLGNPDLGPVPIIIPLILGGVILAIVFKVIGKSYVSDFKTSVIHQIIHFIDPNLSYHPTDYIPQSTFDASKIFTTKPNRYKGDDLVTGRIDKTDLVFSELDAKHESGSGKNRTVVTVFKGLFFIADFNKHFHGNTVVVPDTAERLFGRLGKKLQSLNFARGQLVKLEDPEFERSFAVYADDQIEARYILSTSLMARIMEFKRTSGKSIHLSFIGSNINVAIPYTRSLFEPRIFKTLLDFAPIHQYYRDLALAISIVEELNLNTRIWTKE